MAAFGEGLAVGPDLVACAERAAAQALRPLLGRAPDLAAVFVSGEGGSAGLALMRASALLGAAHVIGCTAQGVLGSGRGIEDEPAVAVWAASLPGARLRSFHLEALSRDDIVGWPEAVPAGPLADRAAVLLGDGTTFPVTMFLNRTRPSVPIVGGAISGGTQCRMLTDGRLIDRGAVGVVIGADPAVLAVGTVVSQGCQPVGPPMTVTAAAGDVLLGLSSMPARARLLQVIDAMDPLDQSLASAEMILGVAVDETAEEPDYLMRPFLGSDGATGGFRVGAVLAVGQTVRIFVRDPESTSLELRAALRRRAAGSGGALVFSGQGRGRRLFSAGLGGADHDAIAAREALGSPAVAGFFTAATLGAVGGRTRSDTFGASVLALGDPA